MSLTLETRPTDIAAWETEVTMVDEWLYRMWGIRAGASSPRSCMKLDPSSPSGAEWLQALWAFTA